MQGCSKVVKRHCGNFVIPVWVISAELLFISLYPVWVSMQSNLVKKKEVLIILMVRKIYFKVPSLKNELALLQLLYISLQTYV